MKDNSISFRWWGHSCFQVTYQDYSIVFDPYQMGSVPGYPPLHLIANEVHCSHDHADHNGVSQVQIQPGTNPWQMQYIDTFHDHHQGAHRGKNIVTVLSADGYRIAHLGDLGCISTINALNDCDVWMIPVGGYYTISALEAKAMIDMYQPKVVLPMHARFGQKGYAEIAPINDFLKECSHVKVVDSVYTYTKDSPSETILFDKSV
ncbi:MAG: MBL fold metallo-hydrolase [Absicoccus porci]|uniref:MBL fold metallo-hydrolase n=1 Tax=Absicoccus porci TaxID=2486576 RepID=UPI002357760F|nr:MBL fold metallo-hydrolase [Absicoccus porci]MCI6087354.1 MBL fold metallo-hydrolase [Absicoccus porci]MDY4739295.1 MBL fold metallo-hydrolase [Absicoccus porci]